MAVFMTDPAAIAQRWDALAALIREGRGAEALPGIDAELAAMPGFAPGHYLRGVACLGLRRGAEAAMSAERACALQPDFADARWLTVLAWEAAGDLAKAIAAARDGFARHPDRVDFGTMGALLSERAGDLGAAYETAKATRDRHPDHANAAFIHAMLAQKVWRLDEAAKGFARAAALDPHSAEAQFGLGNCALEEGDYATARTAYARALAIKPDYEPAWINRLYLSNYDPTVTPVARREMHEAWATKFVDRFAPAEPPRAREPAKRLKIGYVSADFRTHSVAPFIRTLLRHHDRAAFEVHGFSNVENPDAETARLAALADAWHPIHALDDDAAAALVRSTGIDVLIDLSAHTSGNRLGVFARKPAPLQASWLGYCTTTGIKAIDGFLTDATIVPDGHEAAFTETIWRMKHAYAFEPQETLPDVAPAPILAKGYPTFGHFGRLQRVNDGVLRLWARVLDRIPDARLFLNTLSLNDAAVRARVVARFANAGGDTARLDLAATAPQPKTWAAYAHVDVALDPFPFNAGATTFEALWLGVPVVTKLAAPPLGRMGASILETAGLADWIAADDDAYLSRAIEAVRDPAALATLRAGMRDHLRRSALVDGNGFVREFEAAVRRAWTAACG
jgi:predicted O-linked N-acetylglucosamine transferase (SPINDLY family)